MVVRVRNRVRRSGFTNAYQNSSILGTTPWWFWFGLVRAYQSLPTRTYRSLGAFGLVTGPFTIAYQPPDLGPTLPRAYFTKHHRRGGT